MLIKPGDSCWANKNTKLCHHFYLYWNNLTKFCSDQKSAWHEKAQNKYLSYTEVKGAGELEKEFWQGGGFQRSTGATGFWKRKTPGSFWTNQKANTTAWLCKKCLHNKNPQSLSSNPRNWTGRCHRTEWMHQGEESLPEKTEKFKQKPGVSQVEPSVTFTTSLQQA